MRSLIRPPRVAASALLVLGLVLGAGLDACAVSATDGRGGAAGAGNLSGNAAGESQLVVQQNGTVLGHFSVTQLRDLPQVEIVTPQSRGAQVQKGPTVRSVLDAAGVTGVDRVRVEGREPAQTFTASELTDQVILNVTKRNTLKLAGAQLGTDRWIRDVTTLVVNP